jgi:hypothetical protein
MQLYISKLEGILYQHLPYLPVTTLSFYITGIHLKLQLYNNKISPEVNNICYKFPGSETAEREPERESHQESITNQSNYTYAVSFVHNFVFGSDRKIYFVQIQVYMKTSRSYDILSLFATGTGSFLTGFQCMVC